MNGRYSWTTDIALPGAVIGLCLLPGFAQAADPERQITLQNADPTRQGDGTMSPAARRAIHGALPKSDEEVAAKDALTAASQKSTSIPSTTEQPARPQGPEREPLAPTVVRNFEGIFQPMSAPSDSTGAVGTTRYIETINTNFAIYNKGGNTPIFTGTLNQLAGNAATVNSFDPQIIWDSQTNRFYYVMDSVFSSVDNKLSFGFSKTASPSSAADFCRYVVDYGASFPDYPKLGDSQHFVIIGVNTFAGNSFIGSDIIAVGKPPAGTACPDASTFSFGAKQNIKDRGGQQAFTPNPANQIDLNGTGYVVARNGGLPATKLWLFNVTKNGSGNPVFSAARGVTVPSYNLPPNAPAGAGVTARVLDTLDGRNTQAVMAINPRRGATASSFWTQHTIKHPTQNRSIIRLYEINPTSNPPTLRKNPPVDIGKSKDKTFFFNAAITPDRHVHGATKRFGGSFGVGYSVTKAAAPGIDPRIEVVTSLNGGALSDPKVIVTSGGPYKGFDCGGSPVKCRWGDYAAATPDPDPNTTGKGKMWFTNMYASGNQSTARANWRTRNWAVTP